MENRAKPSLGFLRETIVKKFLLAMLTIAALSGAVVVTPERRTRTTGDARTIAASTAVKLDLAAASRTAPRAHAAATTASNSLCFSHG
jgi:hypothetical protein